MIMASTSLSLITAPLVEPRYFILPWLMWRRAVPEYMPRNGDHSMIIELDKKVHSDNSSAPHSTMHPSSALQSMLRILASYSTYLELMWYILINLATCYVFLYRGFEWPQEPGSVQRFMW